MKNGESSYSADKRVDFINQSELINVAVSRAKNRLELVMSQLLFEQAPLSTNIGNLIRYIKYNKGEITFQSILIICIIIISLRIASGHCVGCSGLGMPRRT